MVRNLEGKHPGYYEAILQLRDVTKEIIDFVEEEIKRKKNPVTKIVRLKKGGDYYLADTALTKQIGKKLFEKYGGELKTTASLFGRRKGKELYRTTFLFRKFPFKKGDNVIYKGEEYEIKIIGKDILLKKEGKKIHVRLKDAKIIKR